MKKDSDPKNIVRNTLQKDAFIIANKHLARKIGLNQAILLADLISKDMYFEIRNKNYNKEFFNTNENIEYDTTFSAKKQNKIRQKLVKLNLITCIKKGVPAKNWYSIKYENISEVLDKSVPKVVTGDDQKDSLEDPKGRDLLYNKNNKIKIMNKNKYSGTSVPPITDENNSLIKNLENKMIIKNKDSLEIINYFVKKIRKEKAPTPKQIENATNLLNHLFEGTFADFCTDITETWIKKNKIPLEWLNNKKWTVDEIKQGIVNYSLQFKNGFWPYTEPEKKRLNKDLATFLYNPHGSCPSVFLKLAANKPKRREEQEITIKNEPAVNIMFDCFEKINMQELDQADKNKIIKNVNQILIEHDSFWTKSGQFYTKIDPTYERILGSKKNPIPMFETLAAFLYKRNGDIADFAETTSAVKIDMVKPGTKTWTAFKHFILDNYKLNLDPKKEEQEDLKVWASRLQEKYTKKDVEPSVPNEGERLYNELLMQDIYKDSE